MQRRLQKEAGEIVDLNEARLRFMFDALEQAREWLQQEALHPPVTAVWEERPGENLAAQYAFALGQVDLMVCNAVADAVFGSGDLCERVARLRRTLDAMLDTCERKGRPPTALTERSEVVHAWAFRRARRELHSLLQLTPRSGVVRRPSRLC